MQQAEAAGELTTAQTQRQDFVDNSIHQLVNALVPGERETLNGVAEEVIAFNQRWIARVRETVFAVIVEQLQVGPDRMDEFMMEFYPYLAETEDQRAEPDELVLMLKQ